MFPLNANTTLGTTPLMHAGNTVNETDPSGARDGRPGVTRAPDADGSRLTSVPTDRRCRPFRAFALSSEISSFGRLEERLPTSCLQPTAPSTISGKRSSSSPPQSERYPTSSPRSSMRMPVVAAGFRLRSARSVGP